MYKVSLVPCNSLNGKPIFKYICLPKQVSTKQFWSTFRTNTLLAEIWSQYKLWNFKIHCPSSMRFSLKSFSLYQKNNVFLAFIKVIVGITIAPLSIVWLAYFERWTTLICWFELNINMCSNNFNGLQPLIIIMFDMSKT